MVQQFVRQKVALKSFLCARMLLLRIILFRNSTNAHENVHSIHEIYDLFLLDWTMTMFSVNKCKKYCAFMDVSIYELP